MMELIQKPVFWLFVFIIGAAVVRKIARSLDANSGGKVKKLPNEPGFMDVVKNPEEWQQQMDDEDRALQQAIRDAKKWSDKQVEDAVRYSVFKSPDLGVGSPDSKIMFSLETRTHAPLLANLSDARARSKLLETKRRRGLPEAPFNRICYLLHENPPNEAVSLLIPFLDDKSERIRKDAALILATIGSDEVIAPVRKALSDENEDVIGGALTGLVRAIDQKRLSAACRHELFEDLQRVLAEGKDGYSASVLFQFDANRATQFFLSDDVLTTKTKDLHEILGLLFENNIHVSRDRLLVLLGELNKVGLEYPHDYQFKEVLKLLGRHQKPDDREIFEKYLSHDDKYIANSAAIGLLASHGVEEESVWSVARERGFDASTEPQRHYFTVIEMDGEVNNGGLTQYFFNSGGDRWKTALAGLEAMKFKERLAIFREAIALFGRKGPSTNRNRRMVQLSELPTDNDKDLSDLDNQYYECKEHVAVLAMRYVLSNPEAFR
ncbi:MAG: DUF4375 domain-containing protein [Planctomycetes bacterium]|nr:DUF4375 domain-containing protein [Planctomycetota bacterium]